jgi:hypothetical protein
MDSQNFTTTIAVERTPEECFAGICDVRSWWSGEVGGETDILGAEFIYTVPGVHRSVQKIAELVPGKRVVWKVVDAQLDFAEDKREWVGTDIVFEISPQGGKTEVRFTHRGLAPAFECFDACSNAWGLLVGKNLQNRILTGEAQPAPW